MLAFYPPAGGTHAQLRPWNQTKKISPYLLIAAIAVLLVLIAYLLGLLSGGGGKISGRKLRCVVSQDVTVFGDRVLYYDDSTLFACLQQAANCGACR